MIKTAYFSYWSAGKREKQGQFWQTMARCSVAMARQHFDQVCLITDTAGREQTKDLAFDSVTTELDALPTDLPDLWCLGKLLTYKVAAERGQPFLHIDFDVFLWPNFDRSVLHHDLVAQNYEHYVRSLYHMVEIEEHCPNLYLLQKCKPDGAINVGIFGGRDLDFIGRYAEEALQFGLDPANKSFWQNYVLDDGWKACVVEQYYLSAMVLKEKKSVGYLFDGWANEEEAKAKGYTHLMLAKNKPSVRERIEQFGEKYKISRVVKVIGLPKSGTNVIQHLLAINLDAYVCPILHGASHPNTHLYGWKHGLPLPDEHYNKLERLRSTQINFVIAVRDYSSWLESVQSRHQNSYEFPAYLSAVRGVFYNTPAGPEFYDSYEELYRKYTNQYLAFAERNKERCVLVDFDQLQSDQSGVVKHVSEHFKIDLVDPNIREIHKRVDSSGNIAI